MPDPTTLAQVEKLFKQLRLGDQTLADDTYKRWQAFITEAREPIERWYADDGKPVVFAFEGTGGPKIAVYRYGGNLKEAEAGADDEFKTYTLTDGGTRRLITIRASYKPIDWSTVKGVIVHCHGIAENARFQLLATKAFADTTGYPTDNRLYSKEECQQMMDRLKKDIAAEGRSTYNKSWIEQLVDAGFVVFAMDHQGHGLSEAWKGTRCNAPEVEFFVRDVISLTLACYRSGEIPLDKPLFLSGVSMGGCVLARVLELGFGEGHFRSRKDPVDSSKPLINGALFYCPALSAEKMRATCPNNVLLPFGGCFSKRMPHARLAKLQPNVKFPYITHLVKNDPLVWSKPVPVRVAYDVLSEMDKIIPEAGKIPEDVPVMIILSKHDTMVDPEGSKRFIAAVPSKDKRAEVLDYAWHYLSKEPGYGSIAGLGIQWLDSHLDHSCTDTKPN